MEDENRELNEKGKEFGKWVFGSLTRYFLYLFIHYLSSLIMQVIFGGVS